MLLSGSLSINTQYIKNIFKNKRIHHHFDLNNIIKSNNYHLENFDILILDNYPINIHQLNHLNDIINNQNIPLIYFSGPNTNQYTNNGPIVKKLEEFDDKLGPSIPNSLCFFYK